MSKPTSAQLSDLLGEIHRCSLCHSVVPSEVARSVIPTWNMDLVLMAQAPSEHLQQDFNSLLESQGLTAAFAGGSVPVFTVPHPTAPYKGPHGGRSEYYELAFSALNKHLSRAKA